MRTPLVLAGILVALTAACATTHPRSSLGALTPSAGPTSSTRTQRPAPRTPGPTTAPAPGGGPTKPPPGGHTWPGGGQPPVPPPGGGTSIPPPPGPPHSGIDYYVFASGGCFWKVLNPQGPDPILEVGAHWTIGYTGMYVLGGVPWSMTDNLTTGSSSGQASLGPMSAWAAGSLAANPYHGRTVRFRVTIAPTDRDDDPSDNTATMTLKVPTGPIPTDTYPVQLPCP